MFEAEKNKSGHSVDRSGARWRIAASPEVEIRHIVEDTTADFRLTKPNIWSEGGEVCQVSMRFDLFVPVGAKCPDLEEIQDKILQALQRSD